MSSTRVLIAWEFGSGLGHLACMLPIIRGLRAKGVEPLVAVPDPDKARAIFGAEAPRLIRSVPLARKKAARAPIYSFADILLQGGFADAAAVRKSVEEWQAIYRAERIETVLLDYAPVAQLAAWLMALRMITWTIAFANPPVPFPWIDPDTSESPELLAQSESRLLGCINEVSQRLGHQPIDTLTSWLQAPKRFTTGIAETNVFDFEPTYGYLGPLGRLSTLSTLDWPQTGRTRVLCYLRWTSNTPKIVAALTSPDREFACVIPGAPQSWVATARRTRITATNEVVDLGALMSTADVVVSHGSGGLACEALLKGKPQLLIPIDLEKNLIARRLESQQVAKCLLGVRVLAEGSKTLNALSNAAAFRTASQQIGLNSRPDIWTASLAQLLQQAIGNEST